jgi:hypothetical protein
MEEQKRRKINGLTNKRPNKYLLKVKVTKKYYG